MLLLPLIPLAWAFYKWQPVEQVSADVVASIMQPAIASCWFHWYLVFYFMLFYLAPPINANMQLARLIK